MTAETVVSLMATGGGFVWMWRFIDFRLRQLERHFDNGINQKVDVLGERVTRLEERNHERRANNKKL